MNYFLAKLRKFWGLPPTINPHLKLMGEYDLELRA